MGQTKVKKIKEGAVNPAKRSDYDLFLKPILSEKAVGFDLGDKKRIAFKVSQSATKAAIKSAIEKVFGAKVESVNTLNVQGKIKRTAKGIGRRDSFKKAYVTLKAGESIEVVEGV
jgi:large subunit ribosomal protein L23